MLLLKPFSLLYLHNLKNNLFFTKLIILYIQIKSRRILQNMKKPWYLKTFWIYFFCIVIPVLGYVIVLLNLDKLKDTDENGHSEKVYYLTIATISAIFWILKLTPRTVQMFVLAIILTFVAGGYILKKFRI